MEREKNLWFVALVNKYFYILSFIFIGLILLYEYNAKTLQRSLSEPLSLIIIFLLFPLYCSLVVTAFLFVRRDMNKNDFPIKTKLDWFFYIFGWLLFALPALLPIQFFQYWNEQKKGEKMFDFSFHKRNRKIGKWTLIFAIVIFFIAIIFSFI